jgi:hypothetical protein
MTEILLDTINQIRGYINEPFINNRLRLLECEKWVMATAALDTAEDSANAINYYIHSDSPIALGGLYLHIYGLLQSLSVSQDCISALRKSLLNRETNFRTDSPDLYEVRNTRSDILHATDRGKTTKSYVYLTQWSLSKSFLKYHKQTPEKSQTSFEEIDIEELIEKNNKEINRFLEEIKLELERELKMKKEKYREQKLYDVFKDLNYAAEKILENSHMLQWGYDTTKTILRKYKEALDERYVSWEECVSDAYEIQFINDIYDILDSNILSQSYMPGDKVEKITKVLLNSLVCHLRNLEQFAKEHDECCEESVEDAAEENEITFKIVYPEQAELTDD